jgi:hypothetical protein
VSSILHTAAEWRSAALLSWPQLYTGHLSHFSKHTSRLTTPGLLFLHSKPLLTLPQHMTKVIKNGSETKSKS